MLKLPFALSCLVLLSGFVNTQLQGIECKYQRGRNWEHDNRECRRNCGVKTCVLDVVFAPIADPVNSIFIVDVGTGFQTVPFQGFPAGSHFVTTAVVYPGYTFSLNTPFANVSSLLYPEKIIGTWTATGAYTKTTTVSTSGSSNVNIGLANWGFDFNTIVNNVNSPCAVQSLFGTNITRTINSDFSGTEFPARIEVAAVTGGTGFNEGINSSAVIKSYIDALGNVLMRFEFKKSITLPEL